jgi:hypothetical protein
MEKEEDSDDVLKVVRKKERRTATRTSTKTQMISGEFNCGLMRMGLFKGV